MSIILHYTHRIHTHCTERYTGQSISKIQTSEMPVSALTRPRSLLSVNRQCRESAVCRMHSVDIVTAALDNDLCGQEVTAPLAVTNKTGSIRHEQIAAGNKSCLDSALVLFWLEICSVFTNTLWWLWNSIRLNRWKRMSTMVAAALIYSNDLTEAHRIMAAAMHHATFFIFRKCRKRVL